MARAKRTDRADARRRYRASQVTPDTEDDDPGSDEAVTPARGRAPGGAAPARPGLAGVIGSVRLPNFRQDLAAMPTVIRTTPGVWAAFALGLVAIVAGLTFPTNDSTMGVVILPLLVQPPGIPVLVGGFFAPRGAWFIGGVLGLMQTVGFISYVLREAAASPATTAALDTGGIAGLLVFYIVLGATFAGLASWYRGWLRKMGTRNAAMRAERDKQQRKDAKRSTRPAR